ncbi:2-oxoacid:acceptor oxidoreductase family protein [uncultured Megasphaera sp.]|jgi:2-oxoglutarate ferredoxin oxidoreductase subunit gamma|uniref:2-oxoacid:acceptor oxidoreductase family protein n=1 Tax=uncultured Megasphaera sp. TaxID=165188 RepID=UPI0015BF0749|nr:2-oxoacid:acceptor oxidoreductase family protein [uncultured Megasphaera sp.]
MKNTYELIFAGTGGQGLVTSGIMIAEAGIIDGKNALQTQSYGVAQRGGFSSAEVIISDDEILYQKVQHPDVIIALNDIAIDKYKNIKTNVLYDCGMMKNCDALGWHGIPFHEIAQKLGSPKMANLVAIGAMIEKVPVVSFTSLTEVIRQKFKPNIADMNIEAVKVGMETAKTMK